MTGKNMVRVGCLCLCLCASPARAQRFEAGSPALFQASDSMRWGAGLVGNWDRRTFRTEEGSVRLDLQRVRARLSVDSLPGTDLWVEGGATEYRMNDQSPDWGTEWAFGADLHVLEHTLRSSPVTGRREWIGLNLTGSVRRTRADFDEANLRWREWRSGAIVRYGRKEYPEEAARLFTTSGQAIRMGLIQSRVRGRYGPDRIRKPNHLGFLLGADVLWPSDWVTRMEALLLGSGNQELMLSVSRFF